MRSNGLGPMAVTKHKGEAPASATAHSACMHSGRPLKQRSVPFILLPCIHFVFILLHARFSVLYFFPYLGLRLKSEARNNALTPADAPHTFNRFMADNGGRRTQLPVAPQRDAACSAATHCTARSARYAFSLFTLVSPLFLIISCFLFFALLNNEQKDAAKNKRANTRCDEQKKRDKKKKVK